MSSFVHSFIHTEGNEKREYARLRDPVNRTNECLQQIVYTRLRQSQMNTEYFVFSAGYVCSLYIYMQGTPHENYILGSVNMMVAITSM